MRPRDRLGPILIVLLALLLAPFGRLIGAPEEMAAAPAIIAADAATAVLPAGLPLCRAGDASAPSVPPAHRTACRHCPACLLPLGAIGLLVEAPAASSPRRSWDAASLQPDPPTPILAAHPPSRFARAPPVA